MPARAGKGECSMKKSIKKRALFRNFRLFGAAMAAVVAFAVIAAVDIHAADTIAEVKVGSQTKTYSSLSSLTDDLDDWDGSNVVITMTKDWNNEAERGVFDERLVIPKNSKVTLNMNGYVFDRALSQSNDWKKNGELICMESGSTLTVNGGSSVEAKKRRHDEGVHYSTSAKSYATKAATFYGGVLTGGSSTNGAGGIHVKSDCTLNLNDVTLVGCRSEVPWYDSAATNSGYGGGIWIAGGGSTVKLRNSTITCNHAQEDGGGIFGSNHNNMRVELDNSHVDNNYSRSDGGGINLDGEKLEIKGTNGSTVSGNETPGCGGGIYIWNDEVTVSGLKISDNKAGEGGGVYTLEQTISLLNLEISGNSANTGGGIYVANEKTSITNCTITGNKNGYGVFVKDGIRNGFTLGGSTVIKDNPGKGGKDNLVIEHFNASWITFALKRGADIGIRYTNANYDDYCYLSPDKSADYRQYLTSDDPAYYISYDYRDNATRGRQLAFVRKGISGWGGEPELVKPEKQTLSASQAKPSVVSRVSAGGEKSDSGDYALIRGYLHHEKTDSGTDDTDNIFYYSDAFFYSDPYTYNDHLATASWNLAFGGTYLREGETDKASYKYKNAGARQFFSDIGCPDQRIYVNDSNVSKPGTDTIGVTIGSKKLQRYNAAGQLEDTGDILIPIAVRGGGYEAEWASNVLLGSGTTRNGEAQGFSEAADQVISAVDYYISKYELEDELATGKVKFWVSGFSRAGATANITSKRLIEKYANGRTGMNNQVFGYPCEAAKGGTDKAEELTDKTKYYSIHNMINAGDIVPLVGPEEMGFKRYGVDHYVPGTAAKAKGQISGVSKSVKGAGASGITSVTTYADNERLNSKFNDDYSARRSRMLKHLAAIDSSMAFDDYFQSRGLDIVNLNFGGSAGDYHGSYREDFIIDFFAFLQDEKNKAVTSRAAWATNSLSLNGREYGTIQQAARDTMSLVFSMEGDSTAGVVERASAIAGALDYLTFSSDVSVRDLFDDVLGDWHTLSDADKMKYINYFWDLIEDSGALEFLPDGEAAKLEKNWPVLANLIFTVTDADWDATPGYNGYTFPSGSDHAWAKNTRGEYMMYLLTLSMHLGSTLANHYPELDMAWARTYDSYYDNGKGPLSEASKEYVIDWGSKSYSVDAPAAYVRSSGSTSSADYLSSASGRTNELRNDQRIYLDCSGIKGEAIYYTLEEVSGNSRTTIEQDQIYRGWIDLVLGNSESRTYELTTYARHYGVNSSSVVYRIKLSKKEHTVLLVTGTGQSTDVKTYRFAEGEQVTIKAKNVTDKYFKKWNTLTDGNYVNVESLLGLSSDALNDQTITFTMPVSGTSTESYTWAEDYTLRLTPEYGDKVNSLTISGIEQPVAWTASGSGDSSSYTGTALSTQASVSFSNGISGDTFTQESDIPVVWTYKNNNNETVIPSAGEPVYGKTVYTATISVPENKTNHRLFAMEKKINAVLEGSNGGNSVVQPIVKKNSDGNVSVSITFAATTEGKAQPGSPVTLNVVPYDLNGQLSVQTTSYKLANGGVAVLTAPDLKNEVFDHWEAAGGSSGSITIADVKNRTASITIGSVSTAQQNLELHAVYKPVITAVAATMNAPEAGKVMPSSAGLDVTISNTFEVHPDNIGLSWSPSSYDGRAKALTEYTAHVRLKPDSSGNIKVRLKGSSSAFSDYNINGMLYSDNVSVTMNGKSDSERLEYFTDDNSLSYTFPQSRYILKSVQPVGSISDLPHGTSGSAITSALPKSTKVVTEDGSEMTAAIRWGAPSRTDGSTDPLGASTWTASGTVTLPEGIDNKNNVSLEVSTTVYVKEADTAASPRASVESGDYLSDQMVELSSKTEGATIYYTTDGSDPSGSGSRQIFSEGDVIFATREAAKAEVKDGKETGKKLFTIRAVAEKSGLRQSAESVYIYTFINEVEIPGDRELIYSGWQQAGVGGSAYYTLTPVTDGVTIDDNGDAIARDPGTYKVSAKANDGFVWIIRDENGRKSSTTDEDQIITFRIKWNAPKISTSLSPKKKMITAKWTKVDGAKKYKVAWRKAGSKKWTVKTTKKASYKIKKLKAGEIYQVKVAAVTGKIKSSYSKTARCYLAKSSSVRLKAGKKSIKLSWKKTAKASGYKVYYSTAKSMKGAKVRTVKGGRKTGCTIKNLKKGRKYYVKVVPYRTRGGYKYSGTSSKKSVKVK